MMRELNLEISHPAKGSDTNDPNGNPIKTVPNSASDKCNKYLKSGIRVAHVAKFKPQSKNKIPMLNLFFISWLIPIIELLHPTMYLHVHILECVSCVEP